MKPVMRMLMILIYALCLLTGCGGGNDVVSDDTSGILSIERVNVPAQSGGSGTVSVKLVAPKGGPGSGTVAISATESSLIAFSPTSQSVNSNGTATFYFTTSEVQADTIVPFTVSIGTLSISKPITLKAISSSTTTPPIVISPPVNSIAFVSASPASISLRNTGGTGRTQTSIVSFIVRDIAGQPLAGATIDFTLDTSVGGLSLIPVSAVSDSTGTVKTIVNAGDVSTPVRVTATARGTTIPISVKSDQLIVSTGLPHQDGLSVSRTIVNPEGWGFDGIDVPVTTMLSDHFGNPVPDGTAVYYTCYGGSIEPSATTTNGIATVTWRSQNPRPADGKAKILVYAIGEESFTDLNGNGLADAGEFTDIPEPFLAKSGQPTRDATIDPFIDFNGDNIYNTGDGKFNGILQGNAFTGAARSLYVFNNTQIIMSGSIPTISPGKLTIVRNTTAMRTLTISDENGNSLPGKTTIAFSTPTGSCLKTVTPATITVNNYAEQGYYGITITNDCTTAGSDYLNVTVKTPAGIETREVISVTY